MTATQNWIGTDVSLEISLHEHGIVIKPGKDYPDEWFCLYKVGDNAYDTGYIREAEIDELMKGNEWVKPEEVLSFVGSTLDEWKKMPMVHKLSDLIGYYGYENVMGSSYHTITENEANELLK